MTSMDIVVTDTNIFIDLYNIGMLEHFFNMPVQIHTVDFVIEELKGEKRNSVLAFRQAGKLHVYEETPQEMLQIADLQKQAGGNVSFTDCAAWHYAKQNSHTLLTGDKQLRNKALADNVPVKGVLFIFDTLVNLHTITQPQAAQFLQKLISTNQRLPRKEVEKRFLQWQGVNA